MSRNYIAPLAAHGDDWNSGLGTFRFQIGARAGVITLAYPLRTTGRVVVSDADYKGNAL